VVGLALLAVAAGLATAACGPSAAGSGGAGAVAVVASTDVYGNIVKQVAGSAVDVTSIIGGPNQDPHSYQASAKAQLRISKATIVLENGGGYDDFVPRMLTASHSKATVIDVVDLSGKHAPPGADLNEHVWYDFPTMQKLAARLVSVLSKARPRAAATFAANAERFDAALAGLERTETQIRARHAGEGAAITEPVPLDLLDACGLVNRTPSGFSHAIENGTDAPPRVLQQTLALFSRRSVRLLAYNEQASAPETQRVLAAAKANDVAVVPVTETLPPGQSYLSWMRANLTAVMRALGT